MSCIDLGAGDFRGAVGFDTNQAVVYHDPMPIGKWSTSLRKNKTGSSTGGRVKTRPALPDIDTRLAHASLDHRQSPASAVSTVGKPATIASAVLVSDIERLRLRGSFLRAIARSDGGMGAMPLREVVLPAYGVFVGELSR